MSRRLGIFVLLALAGLGCPKKGGPAGGTAVVDPEPAADPLGEDVFVRATGRGATEDEAHAAALAALATQLLGDARWTSRVPVQLHRAGADPRHTQTTGEGVTVEVGLSRARAAEVMSDFENVEVAVAGPAIWQEPLQAFMQAHRAAQACARRQALFQSECEATDTTDVDASIAELGQGLVLSSAFPEGVPVDAEGKPLRAPVVFVLWRGVPLAGMPLQVEAAEAERVVEPHVLSDSLGRVRVQLAEGAALPVVRVSVDGDALLGAHAELAPKVDLRIEPRPTSLRRWAMVVSRESRAHDERDEATKILRSQLERVGLGAPVSLSSRDSEAVRTAPEGSRAAKLAAVADGMSGRIDVLLLLTYETRFASRKGGGRIWYEAQGTLQALDMWSGRVRDEASATVEADGVGDERADAAARRKLAEALAKDVLGQLK